MANLQIDLRETKISKVVDVEIRADDEVMIQKKVSLGFYEGLIELFNHILALVSKSEFKYEVFFNPSKKVFYFRGIVNEDGNSYTMPLAFKFKVKNKPLVVKHLAVIIYKFLKFLQKRIEEMDINEFEFVIFVNDINSEELIEKEVIE